ncbi:MAG: DUF4401 domain-containing protein [Candidatus Thiodiazotropha sp. (ex Monitilora ramsayi)]|nr:DUF4401 domain-containing protein [Candidatus Thiodiazotropha sp. (ex Monitilora ramsayi)]
MSAAQVTLQDIVTRLQAENLLDADDVSLAYLQHPPQSQPWYIRTMVGFGAWLASLLLIGFVTSFTLVMDGGTIFIGLLLMGAATLLRHRSDHDFPVQCALASSLAGQALLAYGFSEILGHEAFEIFFSIALLVSLLMFVLFPDRVHRVLMVLIATGSLTTLLYLWELNLLVPLLGPAFAGLLILLYRLTPKLVTGRYTELLNPLMNGLMLSAFGTLLLTTVYLLPELETDFIFYPRPWISTMLLGLLFLTLGRCIWLSMTTPENRQALPLYYGLMLIIILCAWQAPGLLLGLIVTLLGTLSGRITYTGAGIGFFALFLAAFFYGIEVTMLVKSATLIATGLATLLLRWVILRSAETRKFDGDDHA